jgi:signal transduction histidine kinase
MRRSPPRADGLTIKAALLLGFGFTLGLWLWAGYDFTRRMAEVEEQANAINVRYMRAQELLSTVRPQVLLVSVNVRNALLDPGLENLAAYARRIARILEQVDRTLERYVPVLDGAAERERVRRLRQEIDAFGETILQVMSSASGRRTADTRDLLARAAPRRDVVIRVTEEVQGLNRAAFLQQQGAIADAYRRTQRGIWQRLGLSILASMVIAIFATLYVGRLENRLLRQREKEAQNARDLQRLSAKLIHAQEEERRSIARELHDEVGQVLTTIKVELTLAQQKLAAAGGLDSLLADAQSIADGALHSVRDLSHLLHPALLDDLGLAAALEWYVQPLARRHHLGVRLHQQGMDGRLPPEVELAAFRIVQEALTNVVKHANAGACVVTLDRGPDALRIRIEDDGRGFDPAGVTRVESDRGLGLLGIRERAWQLLGSMRVESAPGRGTAVVVELPFHRDAAPGEEATAVDVIRAHVRPQAIGG